MLKKLFAANEIAAGGAREGVPGGAEPLGQAELPVASFEEIYRAAPVRSSHVAYSILKVAEMIDSAHLDGMSPEARRASVMMALEAAGVPVDDLLQDAMLRQRALNEHEEALAGRLKAFESGRMEENRRIQAELERITAQHMSRVQANLDQVARQQDIFRAWQASKDAEARRISDAAALCVPKNAEPAAENLSVLLTGASRRRPAPAA